MVALKLFCPSKKDPRIFCISWNLTLAAVFWFVVYAVPAGAKVVAMALPDQLLGQAGDHSIGLLDSIYSDPSELRAAEQARVREVLAPHIPAGPELLYF